MLAASRVVLAVVCTSGSVVVIAAALRRSRGSRGGAAIVAVCTILLSFGSSALAGFDIPAPVMEAVQSVWFVAFPLLAGTFPDGRFVPRWSAWIVAAYAAVMTADTLGGGAIRAQAWWIVIAASQLACLGWAVHRYRVSATTIERESVRWVVLGTLVTVCCFQLIQIADGHIGGPEPSSTAKALLAGLPLSVGLVIGSVWPRLINIDVAFRWFIAVVGAATLTAVASWGIIVLLGADIGVLSVVVAAIVAPPALWFALRMADGIVYRGRPDPADAARRLATALDEASGPHAVAETIARTAANAVSSPRAVLVSVNPLFEATAFASPSRISAASPEDARTTDTAEGVAGAARPDAATVAPSGEPFPIDFRGERLAMLHVSPRAGESALTPRDRAAVTAILAHAGPALHGARALVEANLAQARLVTAREEERRRLRSDLHDDLGPTLSGLALGAAALARNATASAPALAADAEELHRDIQSAVVQTREISHGLRPAVLDDHGLIAAVRARVVDPLCGDLDVDLRADSLGTLPAAVDVAALRIVQEAVANVRRHSGARRCIVQIARTVDGLELTVDDDGVGIVSAVQPGVGLRSIRERTAELGGRARVDRSPRGGTRVRVFLPIPAAAVAS